MKKPISIYYCGRVIAINKVLIQGQKGDHVIGNAHISKKLDDEEVRAAGGNTKKSAYVPEGSVTFITDSDRTNVEIIGTVYRPTHREKFNLPIKPVFFEKLEGRILFLLKKQKNRNDNYDVGNKLEPTKVISEEDMAKVAEVVAEKEEVVKPKVKKSKVKTTPKKEAAKTAPKKKETPPLKELKSSTSSK